MNNTDAEEYELMGQDSLMWLEQAELLRMSAAQVWEKFREIFDVSQVRPGIREQKPAFTRSFMLLMGMSFENFIKGVHIALDFGHFGWAGG